MFTDKNNKGHNKIFQIIEILKSGGFGSVKTNSVVNLIKEQHDIDKIHLYVNDLSEPKYVYF